MEHACAIVLLFLTLAHLSCSEQTRIWYAANVINDGDFSPKPISEIFSTPKPPFSSTNPIVVLPPSTTPFPSISTSFSPSYSTFSPSFSTDKFSSQNYDSPPPSTFGSTTVPPSSTSLPSSSPLFDLTFPDSFRPFPGQQKDPPNGGPNYFLIYQQAPQTLQSQPPMAPQQTFSTFQPSTGFESTTSSPELSSQRSTFSTIANDISSPLSTFSTFRPDLSSSTFSTLQPEVTSTSSTFSTFRPELSSPMSTFSTLRPEISTPQTTWTTPAPRTSTPPTTLITGRPITTTLSTFGNIDPESASTFPSSKSTPPCNTEPPNAKNVSPPRFPTLRIRMVAPSGSITNINVNPSVQATTTKRPPTKRSTTTRKPTTTRTRRTKKTKNTYDGCINMCTGKKPICAVPLASVTFESDQLKGFASVCHMACHNSFKKDQYEMLMDGRCGKLRTRIQTVDSNKLKRVELNKSQYTVINDDSPQTIVELSSLPRK